MKKSYIIPFIFIFIFFIISGCREENETYNPNKVKVGYLPLVSNITHFVAMEKGFYKEEGLSVEPTLLASSDLTDDMLFENHIDIAIEMSIVPLLLHLEKDPNHSKIFSTSRITNDNSFDGILVKQNSKFGKLEDLAGKKVGVFPGITAKNIFIKLFASKYPMLEAPNCIEINSKLHLDYLEDDSVDAIFTYEPYLTIGIDNKGFKQISTSIYAMQFSPNPLTVGAINNEFLLKKPEAAKSFFKAIDKAVEFIKKNPEEVRKIIAKSMFIDSAIASKMNIMPNTLSKEIDFQNLDDYIQLLKTNGFINSTPKAKEICVKSIN
ncbi:MAG TPA: ABC transporter substrate-binding protein [Candidatus Kapabacteria bacterium]|nr:ABC transporter substrate-binding protein [Candidatus Kapabacteria bacterium]HPO63574.1 ABC transporter substrate-binding protein [Candidatus Kapabacteria bacterium]